MSLEVLDIAGGGGGGGDQLVQVCLVFSQFYHGKSY